MGGGVHKTNKPSVEAPESNNFQTEASFLFQIFSAGKSFTSKLYSYLLFNGWVKPL